ncbi:MAG: hypothetical protein KJ981_05225 [Alphaproteobacteria bacterium]|nr:hypothetical protein [Alphaproteobacteria bacterium]MBU0831904.1 hypothetical protein [Alphaproteobacteria bacterium]MBU1763283.1 hypothetical protein [Alphaproteobacteria bacterium]
MSLTLRQLKIGKVDGKHEYLTPATDRDRVFFDAYLIPDAVDPDSFNNTEMFFVEGFRGTGKTSLLRWHANKMRDEGCLTDFVLFKTDLTEAQRLQISTEVGVSWADLDAGQMEISQDFKSAWTWFILHKVGELLTENSNTAVDNSDDELLKLRRLLGLEEKSVFKKVIGFLPKLDGASIKVRADVAFFEAELGGDFKREGEQGKTTLDALSRSALKQLRKIRLRTSIRLYFDELEAFFHTTEQHKRDQRMVRDLLFSIASLNESFRNAGCPIHVVAAVRSEVIDAMGALGQEVDRLVHDKGFLISWYHANRSVNHPLMTIIKKKLQASEKIAGLDISEDPIATYFPEKVGGKSFVAFILDGSFYKPRDIVWRLSLAQKLFPNETRFSADVLHETEIEYSAKLWDEVRYELGATYSDNEVDAIEMAIAGGSSTFDLDEVSQRFQNAKKLSVTLVNLLDRRSVGEILSDLYRLGAIGNSYRAGTTGTDIRNRWSFRGDPNLLPDKRMVIHPALVKRLSTVAQRKRGSRGGQPKST